MAAGDNENHDNSDDDARVQLSDWCFYQHALNGWIDEWSGEWMVK